MRFKSIFILGILILVLSGCKNQAQPTTPPPKNEITITGLNNPKVTAGTRDAIRQNMALFLKTSPYTEFEAGAQLVFYLVSSGEFGQTNISLSNGNSYLADVLYAYSLMSNQRVMIIPVVVGMSLTNGQYAYFSEKYAFDQTGGVVSTSTDQESALADARQRLPRGRIFRLIAYGMVSPQELLWDQCKDKSFMPEDVCQVGEAVEQLNLGVTKLFLLRTADNFPEDWLLVGWVFQEFTVEELAPGVSPDVALPIR